MDLESIRVLRRTEGALFWRENEAYEIRQDQTGKIWNGHL